MTMNRITERRRARKELSTVYRPTADDLAWVADEIEQNLESNFKVAERSWRNKRSSLTPAERVEKERIVVEGRRFVHLVRRDPARLCAMDLRIAIRLQEFKAMTRMPPADRRVVVGWWIAREILSRMIREDPRLRAMITEDLK
jgi:hypothetical protein